MADHWFFSRKVGHVPILGFKKRDTSKFKAFFKKNCPKKRTLRILGGTFFKKAGLSRSKVRRWTAYP
jgi:hypothetical protein